MARSVEFITYGPFFEEDIGALTEEFIDNASEMVADHAVDLILTQLGHVLQNPTGNYESLIGSERTSSGWRVSDSNCIYGPWLEGVGSRNLTTSFKGYATFRKVFGEVDSVIARTVQPAFTKYVDVLNG